MSLYIGNLSVRIRREELEKVFLRFGRCSVQLKTEGYGFVVFDFPPNAEKALRALQGRNICGEPLNIDWSNKQPKSFQRFARGTRSYGLQRGRKSEKVDYPRMKIGSNGWRDKMTVKEREIGDGNIKFSNVCDEARVNRQDIFEEYFGNEHDNYIDGLENKGGGDGNNVEDNGRWGDQVSDISLHDKTQNDTFDRYEPYRDYDNKDCDEDHPVGYPCGSPGPGDHVASAAVNDMALVGREKSEFPLACYMCGEPGHKKRNCPKAHGSHRDSGRSDKQLGNYSDRKYIGEDDLGGSCSKRDERPRRDGFSMRRLRNDKKASSPVRNQFSRKDTLPAPKEEDSFRVKDYREKKRRRKDAEVSRRPSVKKVRRSFSSPKHSDYNESRSPSISHSFKSDTRFTSHSKSGSMSSQTHSLSPNLKSSSKSWHSTSRSPKSRRSSSRTSLLPCSLQEVQNPKDPYVKAKATALETFDHTIERERLLESVLGLEDDSCKETILAVNEGNTVTNMNRMEGLENNHSMQDENNENQKIDVPSEQAKDPSNTIPDVVTLSHEHTPLKTQDRLDAAAALMKHVSKNIMNPDSETGVDSHSGHSTRISMEELYVVLKHYGLEVPKGDGSCLDIDTVFGSARMWPWPIVYYRRLKKGPITIENYQQRVAQNQEFGIVDKYIRSSSGWGELDLENP